MTRLCSWELLSMSSKHGNIAFFVPHAGCPRQCSFCDQRSISGRQSPPTPQEVAKVCQEALCHDSKRTFELAFFGGSFTAIDENLMLSLLSAAQPYLGGKIAGIRISTRPDCIDEDVLRILKDYGVTAIELGAQSMDNFILKENNRGHTAAQTVQACENIKQFGFELGLQMMTGLFQSNDERDLYTAQQIIGCAPDTVRIYPTLTIRGTQLETLWQEGKYIPQTLDAAVRLCADLMLLFAQAGIRVIRVGLHDEKNLGDRLVAGPYHPAFRELCESKIMLERLQKQLPPQAGEYIVLARPQDVSKMAGQKRSNLKELQESGYRIKIRESEQCQPLCPKLLIRETEEGHCV